MDTICLQGKNRFKRVEYTPTCKFGIVDCVYDNAYIQATYPETYDKSNCTCKYCIDADKYDNEDK